jgi:hypothetical protein
VPLIPFSVVPPWAVASIVQSGGLGFEPGITVVTFPASAISGKTARDRSAAAARIAAKRLLATRVGGSATFTGKDTPGSINFAGTGKWTAKLTFRRLR